MNHLIWYNQEAKNLHESLPIGNGRIGAMIFGGTAYEKIQIDESSFWSGCSSENNDRDLKELRKEINTLLLAGNYEEADRISHDFVGNKGNYGTNLPVGNLYLKMNHCAVTDYRRQLDFTTAIAKTTFQANGNEYVRETFVSNPADVFVTRFHSDAQFDLEIGYEGIQNNVVLTGCIDSDYTIEGDAFESLHSNGKVGVHLNGRIRIITDGNQGFCNSKIKVEKATYIEIYLDMITNMFDVSPKKLCSVLDSACSKGYVKLKEEHINDHQSLYNRMSFKLLAKDHSETPTDIRIKNLVAGNTDLELVNTMFNYGRYLLIASSRKNSPLPTHMGGIWNDNIYSREDCTQDFHIDMNTQMQYWLANPCNLQECATALFNWLDKIVVPNGKISAQKTYGARGFTAHVVSNPWGYTALGWGYNWGAWAFGGLWISTLLWDHYLYSQDRAFLKDFAYPILKEAALFASDYLFFDEKSGYYMSGPSYSPENWYKINDRHFCISLSNTCDVLMIREIFETVLKAAPIVKDSDKEFFDKIAEQKEKLPPYMVGKLGQLQEWLHDFDDFDPGHRHTSHLLGLYPFRQIIPDRDTTLIKAAKVALKRRYDNCELTSWTMAFFMYYHARLFDGNAAYEMLLDTFKRCVQPSMISTMGSDHAMWSDNWELDGNTGLTGAMCEMLLQTIPGEVDTIHILPALPDSWKDGEVKGILAAAGIEADYEWKNGELIKCILRSKTDITVVVRYKGKNQKVDLKTGIEYNVPVIKQ